MASYPNSSSPVERATDTTAWGWGVEYVYTADSHPGAAVGVWLTVGVGVADMLGVGVGGPSKALKTTTIRLFLNCE
jgi:hypothetical protein